MAFQKGPGEGYREAKAEALAIDPTLRCKAARYRGAIAGYVVSRGGDGPAIGKAVGARDAWNEALGTLLQARRQGGGR